MTHSNKEPFDIKAHDDNEQMEYLRQQNEKKKKQIARRKERYCVFVEKMKVLLNIKKRTHEGI